MPRDLCLLSRRRRPLFCPPRETAAQVETRHQCIIIGLDWIQSFLIGRSQRVLVEANKVISTSTSVISGVPQGTVLGLHLFVLYMNDFPRYN